MIHAMALSICAMLPGIVDDVGDYRVQGHTQDEAIEMVELVHGVSDFKIFTTTSLIYALPKGIDYSFLKIQILLTCDKEIPHGYQHSHEGPGGRERNCSFHEQHSRICSKEAWPHHSR